MKRLLTFLLIIFLLSYSLSGCSLLFPGDQPGNSSSQSISGEETRVPKEWKDVTYTKVTEKKYLFEASDGRMIHGYQWLPEGAEGELPTIILSHGYNSRSMSMKVDASYYVKRGFACFAFDFCGGNRLNLSDGNFEDMTVDTEIDDLHEIWDHVLSYECVDKENVFLWGASFGGAVTLLAVEQRSLTPKGVVLEYPAFNFAEHAYTGEDSWMGDEEKFIEAAKAYYGRLEGYFQRFDYPTLIVHGDRDAIVDLSYSQYALRYLPNAELEIIEGGGHVFNWDENEAVVWQRIFEFLVRCYN
ncbi:MAG: alpha/beta hydrolase [Clostridia bacterium]|nr:alpha/beta hydrolase [Clostridia bacterium]